MNSRRTWLIAGLLIALGAGGYYAWQKSKDGDLPESASAAALARYLMTVSNSICVQAASGATAEELHDVAAMALTAWPRGKEKPAKRKSKAAAGAT